MMASLVLQKPGGARPWDRPGQKAWKAWAWWYTPVVPTLRKQRQENGVPGQPGLHRKLQASLGYIEKACLKKKKKRLGKENVGCAKVQGPTRSLAKGELK
jgi:hypothetical protein